MHRRRGGFHRRIMASGVGQVRQKLHTRLHRLKSGEWVPIVRVEARKVVYEDRKDEVTAHLPTTVQQKVLKSRVACLLSRMRRRLPKSPTVTNSRSMELRWLKTYEEMIHLKRKEQFTVIFMDDVKSSCVDWVHDELQMRKYGSDALKIKSFCRVLSVLLLYNSTGMLTNT